MKRLLFVLAGILVLGFVLIVFVLPYFDEGAGHRSICQEIEVVIQPEEGAEAYLREDDIIQELKAQGLKIVGVPTDSISLLEVRQALGKNSLLKKIEPYFSGSGERLVIKVRLYTPQLLVYSSLEGETPYYICRGGDLVALNPLYPLYVPVATGSISRAYAQDTLSELVEVVQADEYYRDSFGQYALDAEKGVVLSSRLNDAQIYMGRGGDWREKLHRLRLFQEEVLPRRGRNAYDYVDLRFAGQVVASPMS